ncbi:MAG: methionine adenosyltransferase [Planctomycetota bacterium]
MELENYTFASECVTMGHPDKVADQISDAILDAILAEDNRSRVACETLVTEGMVFVAGEISTNCWVDINKIIRSTVKDIGYVHDDGFLYSSIAVFNAIHEQSLDIAVGVVSDKPEELKAGDQGMMFGFACDDTPELMPIPISLARKLCNRMAEVRQNGTLPWLKPDGKSQVIVEYENGKPRRVREVLLSTQHFESVSNKEIRKGLLNEVVLETIPKYLLDGFDYENNLLVNPTGRFVKGGPAADTGLTGRKIIVDTYGGMGRHGGGCFSGKDPSKVDRTGAYAARYIAKNIVAAGLARKCEIELSYAIGLPDPRAIYVDTFGTGTVPKAELEKCIKTIFPTRVGSIITHFDLLRPIYLQTARYGHFGIDHYPWEQTDMVEKLREWFGK